MLPTTRMSSVVRAMKPLGQGKRCLAKCRARGPKHAPSHQDYDDEQDDYPEAQ